MAPEDIKLRPGHWRFWLLRLFGLMLLIIGAILVIGGVKLTSLGGSPYYLFIGIVLAVAGILALLGRFIGLQVYLAAFVVTFLWAIWEVGFDGWALIPRLVGPFILAIIALLLLPGHFSNGIPTRRSWGAGAALLFLAILAIGMPLSNREPAPLPLPSRHDDSNAYFDDETKPASADWAAWGGGGGQRFSDLSQITLENVSGLKQVWVYHTGDIAKNYGVELTPLKIGDTIYGCSSIHAAFALDAATGKQKWRFDPKSPVEYSPPNSACRESRITITPRLPVARNARTALFGAPGMGRSSL